MSRLSPFHRILLMRIAGLLVAVLALFILLSSVSYLFHWQEDMSLVGNLKGRAGNIGGALGSTVSYFLIRCWFGIGSFAFVVILAEVAKCLFFCRWDVKATKVVVLSAVGLVIFSALFAFLGDIVGVPQAFGSGLGGSVGNMVKTWSSAMIGTVFAFALIIILLGCWLLFCSGTFSGWFSRIGKGKTIPVSEPEPATEQIPEPVQEPEIPVTAPVEKTVVESPDGDTHFTIVEDDGLSTDIQAPLEPIDNRLDPPDGLPRYKFPSLSLLESYASSRHEVSKDELTSNKDKIKATLANYKIQIVDVKAVVGSTVTLYQVYPAPGVQIAQIKRLQEDIGLSLGAKGVRVSTLPDCVGIEVANSRSSIVPVRALLNDDAFRNSNADLPIAIGYTIRQEVKVFDLADAPHLLIAGATKQGKSVGLNVIINSLLFSKHPSELKFVFIDPKQVEFSAYSQLLHHYLAVLPAAESEADEMRRAIVKKPKDAERILRSLCEEMDARYELFTNAGNGVNNIKVYNARYKDRKLNPKNGHRFLPYLVVVVDEYADLTMTIGASPETRAASRSITNSIIRLAQKGRAAGLHVILATQRPSVDVISGIIKSNFPMRIAFRVASRVDSQTILDAPGAERLIGKGDMLFSSGIDSERIQCGFIDGPEIDRVASFISSQTGYGKSYNTPYYLPDVSENAEGQEGGAAGSVDINNLDERFEEAARMVVTSQRGSTSDLQRKLGMGYARAGKVMDQLEAAGVVGPQDGSKPRQVLVSDLETLQSILDAFL